jgi:hypothetical protein
MTNDSMSLKSKDRTCGECKYREYGSDTHYVCHFYPKKYRVNRDRKSCMAFSLNRRIKV